jgi:response regulator RpfG family c-di-GMP phosphodiesterase
MREVRRLAGFHLDPELVAAFVELWDEGRLQQIIQEIEPLRPEEDLLAA